jgi:hypothetical protein
MNEDDVLTGLVGLLVAHGHSEVEHMRQIALSLSAQLAEAQDECAHWKSIAMDFIAADDLRQRANERLTGRYGRGSM